MVSRPVSTLGFPGAVAQRAPDRPAVIMGRSGEVITYAQLEDRSRRVAQVLRRRGLRPGDRLALLLENHPRYAEIIWGAIRAGLYFTPINTHLTASEVDFIVNDSGATGLIGSRSLIEDLRGSGQDVAVELDLRLMVDNPLDGYESLEGLMADVLADPLPDEAEGRGMFYSSGTTGRPKGIAWPLGLEPIGTRADPVEALLRSMGLADGDVYLSPAPLYHTAPANSLVAATRIGATVVVMERFDALDCLGLIEKYQVTHGQFVPTMFVRMLKLPPELRLAFDMSSLQAAIHAAAPCPIEIKRQMIQWWGPVISEYYAATEGAGSTFITSEEWLTHPGSVGRAMVGTPHILDDDGAELPTGAIGTVWFEGGLSFEYHNNSVATEESHRPGGLATTGDIGYLDAEGYLYLTDRRSFMIISGGVNIYPQESENILITHPRVADAAVFGIPHSEMGEEVKAVVQLVDPTAAGPGTERELIEHCRSALAAYKCPRSIDFTTEMPRLDNGKLYKQQLRDRYCSPTSSSASRPDR
jgi:fatty-acyl-CoA synthase